ncbi:MAG: hypothetical protein RMM17_03200 [Acidobacteriota bacterium]|nr:hypothetical protein [Blastocatellia bacterium]MDW8411676.1 hypothetical protein [Acidobacteriota bacterium]
MEKIREAVAYYNSLLEQTPSRMEELRDVLTEKIKERKMIFGGRPLSPYLRPHFVSVEQWDYIKSVCRVIWRCIEKIGIAIKEDVKLQDEIGLSAAERELVAIDPGFSGISINSRLDSFLTEDSYQFVELNAENPAGISYCEVMAKIFLDLPVMKEFSERFAVYPLYARKHMLATLLKAYSEWSNSRNGKPKIAIVDLRGLPTQCEFEQFQEFFRSEGYEAEIIHPDELEYSGGRLRRGDFEIDIVYRRLLVNEFLENIDTARPLLEAYRERAVCVVNSFRSKFVHKKMLFGLLTDEKNSTLFSQDELAAISKHIPWTRRMRECKTLYEGKEIDLVEFARQNREMLVLKPNDEYGGKGVFVGWELDQSQWDEAIQTALNGDYLLQKRVGTAREVFPYFSETGEISFLEQLVDLDPLLFYGEVQGAFTRLSSTSLCNVTSGGGMVPTFVIDRK